MTDEIYSFKVDVSPTLAGEYPNFDPILNPICNRLTKLHDQKKYQLEISVKVIQEDLGISDISNPTADVREMCKVVRDGEFFTLTGIPYMLDSFQFYCLIQALSDIWRENERIKVAKSVSIIYQGESKIIKE